MKVYIAMYNANFIEDNEVVLIAARSEDEAIHLLAKIDIYVHDYDVHISELVSADVDKPQILGRFCFD